MKDRSKLTTEKRNLKTADIDRHSTLEIVDIINNQDMLVAPAGNKRQARRTGCSGMPADLRRQAINGSGDYCGWPPGACAVG
jgi:hypothetical protein